MYSVGTGRQRELLTLRWKVLTNLITRSIIESCNWELQIIGTQKMFNTSSNQRNYIYFQIKTTLTICLTSMRMENKTQQMNHESLGVNFVTQMRLVKLIRLAKRVSFSSLPSFTHLEDNLPDKRGPFCNQGYTSSWSPLLGILHISSMSVCRRTSVVSKTLDTCKWGDACGSLLFIGKNVDHIQEPLFTVSGNRTALLPWKVVWWFGRKYNMFIAALFTITSLGSLDVHQQMTQWRKFNT